LRRIAQFFADLAGHAFRLMPRGKRFDAARRIALALAPLYRHTPFYAGRPSLLDGPREECLRMLLRTMTRTGVLFDPQLDVDGGELLPPGAALIVSGHFHNDVLASRWLEDHGHPYTAVIGTPREPLFVAGTARPLDLLMVGPQVLVKIRGRLAQGRTVFIDLDESNPAGGWTPVDTVAGRRYVSGALFKFAERTRTPLLFAVVRFGGRRRVTLRFARPSANDAGTMLAEYCDFLRAEAAAVMP
jgi:hypothetical protein